jgi:LysR family hydrogen peroxide-inducible transcriptional activator
MVAAGMGVTLVPRLAVPDGALTSAPRRRHADDPHIRYLPIVEPDGSAPPTRRVVLVWRRSFTRYEAIAALRNAVVACGLPGVKRLT